MDRATLARALVASSRLAGTFRLRSGVESTEYFDKYRFEAEPRLLRAITDALVPLVPPSADILAGLELGGVPVATLLAQQTGHATRFVRKAAKPYGTAAQVEGGPVAQRRVVIVEDVVTSGGAILEAVRTLRSLGAQVTDALCVIDREAGGARALAAEGVRLQPLFVYCELIADSPVPGAV
jgi:orotate phosphoribosyltransferase